MRRGKLGSGFTERNVFEAMRILIAFNIAVPFFLAVTMVAGEKWELMVLPGSALILL
jgi:hypothetical protein